MKKEIDGEKNAGEIEGEEEEEAPPPPAANGAANGQKHSIDINVNGNGKGN